MESVLIQHPHCRVCWQALHYACAYDHPSARVEVLARSTSGMTTNSLSQVGCVEALVRAGCDMTVKSKSGNTAFELALQRGHFAVVECMERLAKAAAADAALGRAAMAGDVRHVRRRLDAGEDPDILLLFTDRLRDNNESTMLCLAVEKGRLETAVLLLDR